MVVVLIASKVKTILVVLLENRLRNEDVIEIEIGSWSMTEVKDDPWN